MLPTLSKQGYDEADTIVQPRSLKTANFLNRAFNPRKSRASTVALLTCVQLILTTSGNPGRLMQLAACSTHH